MERTTPRHVGIIMDGNGRWAEHKGQARTNGHDKGAKQAREIIRHAAEELGVNYLTVYAFSTENYKRKNYEVKAIMRQFHKFATARRDIKELQRLGVAVKVIGNRNRLSESLQKALRHLETETQDGSNMVLQVAIAYGGHDELVRAVNKLLREHDYRRAGEVTEQDVADALDTRNVPDVDLLIRTGGERRLSNFLPWQTAYAECRFVDELWPDYTTDCFDRDIRWFTERSRRFGAVPPISA